MKKIHLIGFGLMALASVLPQEMSAIPAKPGILTVTTADGDDVRVLLRGDEYYHQYFTEDGYPLVEKDGNFYYGDISEDGSEINSSLKYISVAKRGAAERTFISGIDMAGLELRIKARAAMSPMRLLLERAAERDIQKWPVKLAEGSDGPPYERGYGLFRDVRFPAYGDQKAIVILVEFTDVQFDKSYDAQSYFTRMLNQDGFADLGATGSAAEYFRLNSGGTFRPEFDVYGPLTLPGTQAYYGGDLDMRDKHAHEMVRDACDILDPSVDFRDYDRNDDGFVDNIFIFYAGRGQASGGSANTIWPHSWDLVSAGMGDLEYDGVKVHTYGCTNEWEQGRPDGVGTFIHEFSHVMGLPDLYATSYTDSFTPGRWSALDYGPYNNDGMTPPNYSAFERYALGWIKPHEIDGPASANLQPIDENVCGIIRTGRPTEFFLLENRQNVGWDKYIPGHGMLIWHIDYNEQVWTRNIVNNTSSHQYVDIVEADGTETEFSRSGDAFPGDQCVYSFTPNTNPAMRSWSGTALNYPLTNIREEDDNISFDILGGGASVAPMPVVYEADNVASDSFRISWKQVEGYESLLSVFSLAEGAESPYHTGHRIYLPGLRNRNIGETYEYTVNGLESDKSYYYTVKLVKGWEFSADSPVKEAFTGYRSIDFNAVQSLEATEIADNGFTANWKPLEEATEYFVKVYEMVSDGNLTDECDFFGGLGNIGKWTTTSTQTYDVAAFCGESAPALRLNRDNVLTSPTYDDYVCSLSFWHRGNATGSEDVLNVYAVADGIKTLVGSVPVVAKSGGAVTELTDFPEFTEQVEIEFKRMGKTGSVAVDDICLGHGSTYIPQIVEGFNNVSAGNICSMAVNSLKADTEYAYSVHASDGALHSRESDLVYVRTSSMSYVGSETVSETARFHLIGHDVYSADDTEIEAYSSDGMLIASGLSHIYLPDYGFYIIRLPKYGRVYKIIIN